MRSGACLRSRRVWAGAGICKCVAGGDFAGQLRKTPMTRIARTAWNQAQTTAVVALCMGATLALPLALAAIGFHTL